MTALEKNYIRKLNISKCKSLQLGTFIGYIIKLYHPCDHSIKHIDIKYCVRPSSYDNEEDKKKKRIEAIEYIENLKLHNEYITDLHIDNINNNACRLCSPLREKSFFELIDDLIHFQNSLGKRFWDDYFIAPEKLPSPPQAYDKKYSYLNIHIEDAIEFCKRRHIELCFKEFMQEKFRPLNFNNLDNLKKIELEKKLDDQLYNLSLNKRKSKVLDRYKPPFLVPNSRSLTNIVIHLSWLLYCDGVDSPSPEEVYEKLKLLTQECMKNKISIYFAPIDRDEITKIKGTKRSENETVIEWETINKGETKTYTLDGCEVTVNKWKRQMRAVNWIQFDS